MDVQLRVSCFQHCVLSRGGPHFLRPQDPTEQTQKGDTSSSQHIFALYLSHAFGGDFGQTEVVGFCPNRMVQQDNKGLDV